MAQTHVLNYHKALGYDLGQYIKCECCPMPSVEIHHLIPRSKFGKKTKHLQDEVTNLVALCRFCHSAAHNNKISKETLLNIIANRK